MLNETKTSRPRPKLRGRGRGCGRGQNFGLEATLPRGLNITGKKY